MGFVQRCVMPSRRRAIATLVMAGAGAACRTADHPNSARRLTVDDLAEQYVRLTLQLAQHQPSLVEDWLGPEDWRPGARIPVADIQKEILLAHTSLAQLTSPSGQADRYRYLLGQLKALVVAARRLAGESMRFWEEASGALGVDETSARSAGLQSRAAAAARAELEQRLPGRGPLHARYAAFRGRHALSDDRIIPTFRAAMHRCRDRVRQHALLPEAESVAVDTATRIALEARARYEGGFRTRVTIDTSAQIDLARLLWLAAHEAYPGHHMQHVLADRDCVRARGWHERALYPAFGPHLLCAEGAAEAGAALLLDGDTFEIVCRELAPVAGTSTSTVFDLVAVHRAVTALSEGISAVAQRYLDGEIGSEEAADRLTVDALVADARQFLVVIERQRTRLLAYPLGRRIVFDDVLARPPELQWQRLTSVATMLTTSEQH